MAHKAGFFLAALVAAAQTVVAHAYVTSVWVNGQDTFNGNSVAQGSTYMRVPSSNSPVQNLNSASMACNDRGKMPVSGFLTVSPGDTIEPEWWHSGARGSDPIDGSHKGPLTTWISPLSTNTEGNVWVQIASEAFYKDSNQWAVSKMIANRGRNTVKIPSTLAPGDYLIRFDLLALHEGQNAGGAHFYPSCAQVRVVGAGTQTLPAGVAIPGFYMASTPGVVWNIYYSSSYDVTGDYIAPGTGVWDGSATYSTAVCREKIDGLAPAGYCQTGGSSPPTSSSSALPGISTSTSSTSSSSSTSTTTTATSSASPNPSAPAACSGVSTQWGQCGGIGYSGPTCCPSGTYCSVLNPWYSQCLPSSAPPAASTTPAPTTSTTTSRTTTVSSSSASSSSAASSTSPVPVFTDYNTCMRAYNTCLDEHQPKNGGPANFSFCYANYRCSGLPARKRRVGRYGRE
ncbi:hypothetical protein JCM8097_001028 [Rhodosporidiobolus ruineniae]